MSVVVQTQTVETDAAVDDPLLSYTVTTTPSPLKASPENAQDPEEVGEIVITFARQSGTPADVEWIKVKVPAGTMAPDLATDLAKISPRISLAGWTARLDSATKEFIFTPTGSHATIGPDTGFTIQLSDIPINRKVGTSPITITERSSTGSSAFQNRPTVVQIGKFPADFYLRNFLCEPSIIPNGDDVKLTWERSPNATYELLYGDVNRDVTNRTSLEIEGVKSDTTFYIRATTGDPTNPVVRILSAQVTVLKPDLNIGNLTVSGDSVFNGTLTTRGPADLSQGELKVFGESYYELSGNVRPDSPWTYDFPCDGLFFVRHVGTEFALYKADGSLVADSANSKADEGEFPLPVRKSWRLKITARSSGHAYVSFCPFGVRS
ncbi:hypothetical protein ABZ614_45150 [Streptomyces sp. NPDC013178]|uniref:hypothetical protein n=1 Tax=Streptomyces sp. NPDC013178 TaxID=3155118 RepID=UPI0033DE9D2A